MANDDPLYKSNYFWKPNWVGLSNNKFLNFEADPLELKRRRCPTGLRQCTMHNCIRKRREIRSYCQKVYVKIEMGCIKNKWDLVMSSITNWQCVCNWLKSYQTNHELQTRCMLALDAVHVFFIPLRVCIFYSFPWLFNVFKQFNFIVLRFRSSPVHGNWPTMYMCIYKQKRTKSIFKG